MTVKETSFDRAMEIVKEMQRNGELPARISTERARCVIAEDVARGATSLEEAATILVGAVFIY